VNVWHTALDPIPAVEYVWLSNVQRLKTSATGKNETTAGKHGYGNVKKIPAISCAN
jgi:hypothetical protein